MIRCGECTKWQHAICFGFLDVAEVPELHICEQCAKNTAGSATAKSCTDKFLQFLSPAVLQVNSYEFCFFPQKQQTSKPLIIQLSLCK